MRRTNVALGWVLFTLSLLSPFAVACSCGGDEEGEESEPNPLRREMRELTLLSPPGESNQPSMFSPAGASLRNVLDRLEEVRTDEHVVALFVRLGPMGGAYGQIDDVAEALQAVRDAGKPVHCHFETIDNTGYALAASACDRITMTPAGMADVVGVAAQVFYMRSMLEHLGIVADIAHMGRFKDAAEPLVRDDMGPETRESLGALVDDLHQRLLDAMVRGRGMTPEAAQSAIDQGPTDSATSLALHLVDGVEFDDEARTRCREAGTATRNVEIELVPHAEPMGIGELLGALSGGTPPEEVEGPRIVLAYVDGEITDAEESGGGGTGQAGPFIEGMREIAADEDVRAMVLRIDSPGGSALASDRMWHAVRRLARRKPVVASVGGMAASGGYYVASAATTILADRSSLVGSIGVVGGKVEVSALLERLGVSSVVLSRGAHADIFFPFQRFDDEERRVLGTLMQRTYERFLSRVREGRHLEGARLAAAAEGRIFAAEDAEEAGLVDGLGGLEDAFVRARALGSVGADTRIVEWQRRQGLFDVLGEWLGDGEAALAPTALSFLPPELAPLRATVELLRSGESAYASLPYWLDLR